MKYEAFLTELKGAGLSGRAFARLLDLHPNTISNYKVAGEVPSHLCVIASLIRSLVEGGIDYGPALARVPLKRKAGRGTPIGGTDASEGPNSAQQK